MEYTVDKLSEQGQGIQALLDLDKRLKDLSEMTSGLRDIYLAQDHKPPEHTPGPCASLECPTCQPAYEAWAREIAQKTRSVIFENLALAAEATELVPQLNHIARAYEHLAQGNSLEAPPGSLVIIG
jgi:hypothetical protein